MLKKVNRNSPSENLLVGFILGITAGFAIALAVMAVEDLISGRWWHSAINLVAAAFIAGLGGYVLRTHYGDLRRTEIESE